MVLRQALCCAIFAVVDTMGLTENLPILVFFTIECCIAEAVSTVNADSIFTKTALFKQNCIF